MEVFAISPASSKPIWFVFIICLILLFVLLALGYIAYSSQYSRVEINGDRLRLVGVFWGREIALSRIKTSQVRLVDLTRNQDLYPKRRSLGTGLPGYASGWFRLANGEKSLVYLTDRCRVAYIPTDQGYSLLLSVEQGQQFIDRIREYDR